MLRLSLQNSHVFIFQRHIMYNAPLTKRKPWEGWGSQLSTELLCPLWKARKGSATCMSFVPASPIPSSAGGKLGIGGIPGNREQIYYSLKEGRKGQLSYVTKRGQEVEQMFGIFFFKKKLNQYEAWKDFMKLWLVQKKQLEKTFALERLDIGWGVHCMKYISSRFRAVKRKYFIT